MRPGARTQIKEGIAKKAGEIKELMSSMKLSFQEVGRKLREELQYAREDLSESR